eukprot:11213134-Lingulodinium_polyedra.AAC.1
MEYLRATIGCSFRCRSVQVPRGGQQPRFRNARVAEPLGFSHRPALQFSRRHIQAAALSRAHGG